MVFSRSSRNVGTPLAAVASTPKYSVRYTHVHNSKNCAIGAESLMSHMLLQMKNRFAGGQDSNREP